MLDCSRNAVFSKKQVFKIIDTLSAMGYNGLMLYTEDTYEVKDEPYFGRFRGRYTKEEIKEIDKYAISKGIELIPCVQTLAHVNGLVRWERFAEIIDIDDIFLADDEKTYDLIDKMMASLAEAFTSRTVHIGMDEAAHLGRGKFLNKFGYEKASEILLKHLRRVNEIAAKYGFRCMMWSDMFFNVAASVENDPNTIDENLLQSIVDRTPKDVTQCFWTYALRDEALYDEKNSLQKKLFEKVNFTGGCHSWFGYAPKNKISLDIAEKAINSVLKNKIDNVIVTFWGDTGAECSFYAVLPVLYYYAKRLNENKTMEEIRKNFASFAGIDFEAMLLLDCPNEIIENQYFYSNPSFYMLYCDYFSGTFDSTVAGHESALFEGYAKKLHEYVNHEKYGYVYDLLEKLCKVLSHKYELGHKTRIAYQSNDLKGLNDLIEKDYKPLIALFEELQVSFNRQWLIEHKTSGLEIHAQRFGAMINRTKQCIDLLNLHIEEGLDIAELNEPEIDPNNREGNPKEPILCSQYSKAFSVNVYSH